MSEATFLFLKVSGDEAVKSASEVLSRLVSGMVPAQVQAEALPAPAATAIQALPATDCDKAPEVERPLPDGRVALERYSDDD